MTYPGSVRYTETAIAARISVISALAHAWLLLFQMPEQPTRSSVHLHPEYYRRTRQIHVHPIHTNRIVCSSLYNHNLSGTEHQLVSLQN